MNIEENINNGFIKANNYKIIKVENNYFCVTKYN